MKDDIKEALLLKGGTKNIQKLNHDLIFIFILFFLSFSIHLSCCTRITFKQIDM